MEELQSCELLPPPACSALKPCCYISFQLNALSLSLSFTVCIHAHSAGPFIHEHRAAVSPPAGLSVVLAHLEFVHFDSNEKKCSFISLFLLFVNST